MTTKSSSITDTLPLQLTKTLCSYLTPIYKHILTDTRQTGLIPDQLKLKLYIISPFLKKLKFNPIDLANYRHFTTTTTFQNTGKDFPRINN